MHLIDLGSSFFYNDIFIWNEFHKRKNDYPGQFFRMRRVRLLLDRHELFLLKWFGFVEAN